MGFAAGAITFRRFFICGEHPSAPSDAWLEAIRAHAFGRQGEAAPDGVETGWIVPAHLFDVDFSFLQRIEVDQFLFLGMRLDRTAAPGAIVRSYRVMEEQAILSASGRERLNRSERLMARDAAALRAEQEARDGAFRKITAHPVVIDLEDGVVYLGSLGAGVGDKFMALFEETFRASVVPASIDEVAHRIADRARLASAFDDARPQYLADPPGEGFDSTVAGDRAFLGREFLTWLWHRVETDEGMFDLDSGTSTAMTIHKLMQIDCPHEITGKDTFRADAPGRLAEARLALRTGKMPTKLALILGDRSGETSLVLDGNRWTISGMVPPKGEPEDAGSVLGGRFSAMRDTARTLDLLFESFLRIRLGGAWPKELSDMIAWASGSKGLVVHRATG
jgi:hypothetical protein